MLQCEMKEKGYFDVTFKDFSMEHTIEMHNAAIKKKTQECVISWNWRF